VRTYISDDVVLCVMQDAATVQDRKLRDAGRGEAVREYRGLIRQRLARELASIVEEAVGRRVISTLGDFEPDKGIVALVFPLEPLDSGQLGQGAERSRRRA
jgi:uncharacterized protein YbcI